MKSKEGENTQELTGFEAWKAHIRNILIKIDNDNTATDRKTKERIKNLNSLAEKVSKQSDRRWSSKN